MVTLGRGRVDAVQVGQSRLAPDLSALVTAASLSLSTTQTSQLDLTFLDGDLSLTAGGFLPKRTPVGYGGLSLEVAVREIVTIGGGAGRPGLHVTCRAAAVQRLKRRTGAHVWSSLSYTQWLASEAAAVGAHFIGQPSPAQRQVIRKAEKGSAPESSWDSATRAASELGFILFEAAGVIYFGRPSWIVATQPRHVVRWAGAGAVGTNPYLLQVPAIRDSDDDLAHGLTGTLNCKIELAETLMPGHSLQLSGLGPFSAAPFLISSMAVDLLAAAGAHAVGVETPVDPAAQPPGASTASFDLPADAYGGTTLDQTQATNAAVIYTVGQEVGASDRDIAIAFMAAMVESRMRNLTGPPTDHTSRGAFQQQDNWGSVAQRQNLATAAQLFFSAPKIGMFDKVPNRDRLPMGQVAQLVQVSAYPDRYADYQTFALALIAAIHRAGA